MEAHMELVGWMVGVLVVTVFGSAILFTWAMCRSSSMQDEHLTALDYKRELEVRYPPSFAIPAAKGFKRDRTIGKDQVTRTERKDWIG
jgi:hypothetical protein